MSRVLKTRLARLLPASLRASAFVLAVATITTAPQARAEGVEAPPRVAAGGLSDEARANPTPPSVVELFTSQGCPKCPPADRLIAEFAARPGTIALSYPVSLWDFEGWKDTLASSAFTQRQRGYAATRGDRQIFTPQAIIDGVGVEPGADRDAILRDVAAIVGRGGAMSVPMTLAEGRGRLVIDIDAKAGSDPAGVYVLRVAHEKVVEIGHGENSGRKVTYTNVVRAIAHVGDWHGDPWHFELPELEETGEGYVVLLQTGDPGRPGRILAARKTANL